MRAKANPQQERMTKLLTRAMERAQELPAAMQDEIARLVLAYAGEDRPVYRLSPEEAAELDEAEAAEARGDFATDTEIRAIWAKHGL